MSYFLFVLCNIKADIMYDIMCDIVYENRCDASSTAQGGGGTFKNRKPIGKVGCCESGMAERSH